MEKERKHWLFLLVPIIFVSFYISADKDYCLIGILIALVFGIPALFAVWSEKWETSYIISKYTIILSFVIMYSLLSELSESNLLCGYGGSGLCSEGTWCWFSGQIGVYVLLVISIWNISKMVSLIKNKSNPTE